MPQGACDSPDSSFFRLPATLALAWPLVASAIVLDDPANFTVKRTWNAPGDLGIPLAIDPRPVRIEARHGAMRHCFEFGGTRGGHKIDKKLLARLAEPATACPAAPSASEAFGD